jgi:prepilin-type processing-associated H-X9-DG protein
MRKICCVAIACLLFASSAHAQALADRVPADASIYVGWKGSDTPGNGYAGSHLQAIIDASGFANLRDQFLPQLMQKLTAQSKDHGEAALAAKTSLEILFRHPCALFVAGIAKGPSGQPVGKVGLLCQAGQESDALLTIFNAAAHGPDALPLAQAFASGDCTAFLVGYDADTPIPAPGDAAHSLASNDGFLRMTRIPGRDQFITVYADVPAALSMVDQAMDLTQTSDEARLMWHNARDASGIAGVKHVWSGGWFEGKDWKSELFVDAPAPRGGLLKAFEPTAIDPGLLARVPSAAAMSAIGQFSLGEWMNQIRATIAAASPNGAAMFDKVMGVLQMTIGRNLLRDILQPMGPEWALYSDPSIPAPQPLAGADSAQASLLSGFNIVLINKLADAEKAKTGWTMLSYALSNASAGFIRSHHLHISTTSSTNGDQPIYTIVLPTNLQPSWTVKDGFMYFGFSPEGVTAAANRASGQAVTEQPEFQTALKQLALPGAYTGFHFANLPATGQQLHARWQQAADALRDIAGEAQLKLPDTILPPMEKLLPELEPALSVYWADDAGWHARACSPFPGAGSNSPSQITSGLLGIKAMLPALRNAREAAKRAKCASDERQMGEACLLYANDHAGKYPANVADLLDQALDPHIFLCPASNTTLPANYATMARADLARWLTDHGDYVYCGAGLTTGADPAQIVVYEKPEDHKTGMNILFADSHVEFKQMADAVQLIRSQHKTVPAVPLPDPTAPTDATAPAPAP